METCICQFYSTKSRIALQVARKIAPCDRAFSVKHLDENEVCDVAIQFSTSA